jgi:hypothetical protein
MLRTGCLHELEGTRYRALGGITLDSSPLSRSKLPFAAPPSIPKTFTPLPCSHFTSPHSCSNRLSSGVWSLSVILPGPSLMCIAATMMCVMPVLLVRSGSSEW